MSSGWGCTHEDQGTCRRLSGLPCDPGMKGCILSGRFHFVDDVKDAPVRRPKAKRDSPKHDGD